MYASHLLHLELDGGAHGVDLALEVVPGVDEGGELTGLGQTGAQQTRDLEHSQTHTQRNKMGKSEPFVVNSQYPKTLAKSDPFANRSLTSRSHYCCQNTGQTITAHESLNSAMRNKKSRGNRLLSTQNTSITNDTEADSAHGTSAKPLKDDGKSQVCGYKMAAEDEHSHRDFPFIIIAAIYMNMWYQLGNPQIN